MDFSLRLEQASDFRETENLIREAFWDVYKPGCDEHLVAHRLRNAPCFVGELDYVALHEEKIIGNIMYSRAGVVDEGGFRHEVLCMGPVCVLPGYRRRGIGRVMIIESVTRAWELGFPGIFLYGNPGYYGRFGFVDAKEFDVRTSGGMNFDFCMGLELEAESLAGVSGRFFEDDVFRTDGKELEEFEKLFPPRQKHVTDTQLK